MRIHHNVRYVCFCASAAALLWLAMAGIIPIKHPFRPNEYLIDTSAHSPRTLRNFFRREDVILALTWAFATAGPSLVLPADFNTASNQINGIGSGTGGVGAVGINGGNGGAGGAFAQRINYNGHSAGQTVNCTVGAGDTIFDTSLILLAKAASGSTGGAAGSSVGTTTFSGGNGGTIVTCPCLFSTGAGGGGAGGPHGNGNNGANSNLGAPPVAGASGGSADAGNTAANANGTQFDSNHGGGGGGDGGGVDASSHGLNGNNAGSYGGGGGGGGGGICIRGNGGNGFQGLIAIGYTPAAGGGGARSYGFIIG